jgi:hypothetical protein
MPKLLGIRLASVVLSLAERWSTVSEGKMENAASALIAAFDRVNLVALGERHWAREDSQFRLKLIQHPAFAQKASEIVIEFGNPLYQGVLDRFVNGEGVPSFELRKVWQNTTQPGAWDSPVHEEFIVAVRSVNAELPLDTRLRVLAADYPIDWNAAGPGKLNVLDDRDQSAAAVIQEEVLNKNRKALVLFGSAHLYRGRPGTIVELPKTGPKTSWFVVVPVGGPGLPAAITANDATPTEPTLLTLANDKLGKVAAADVLEQGGKRIKVVAGKPVFADGKPVFVPVFESGIKLCELADACLYFGSELPEFMEPPPALYDGSEYGREIQERRKSLLAF